MVPQNNRMKFFFITNIIWIVAIFLMSLTIFFIIRCLGWYFIGGMFLFSFEDIKKAFKVGISIGPIGGTGTWIMYHRQYNSRK
ncbi:MULTISPECIES: hypothetical protein [Photorhabdus]|uniref:Uncharacterized protein n=1 Tax=Photorhabdus asymbiotica TaxID=291112 RepID=A0ABX9SM02_9GAMM|nr:hypothetical protein [Photorhabdus asymbiotica]RKS57259.1 hypothetical protein BDD30_3902 [Photorhabdus asymbiotica]